MTLTSIHKDPEALTMTMTNEYDAPIDRVWQLWSDPGLLARWWGPPTYPATVVEHDLVSGGKVTYFMTGPEGDRHAGWWRIITSEAPRLLEFEDGFADEFGTPNAEMPTMLIRVSMDERPSGGTRMLVQSTFPSREAMEQLLAMGMEEGLTAAAAQTDALLSEVATR